MKKQFLVLAAVATTALTTVVAVSCKRSVDAKGEFAPRATHAGWSNPDGLPEVTLPTVINTTVALSQDTLYVVDGKVFVNDGGVLEIPGGTRVEAKPGPTSELASAIVVTRGGKLNARGTASNPVVFTSHQSCPVSGDWGGIVLLGRAPLNRADTTIEGINLPTLPPNINVDYGGGGACQGDVNDNSGILTYVRIEYAGAIISENNELNGLTCGGVGAGTVLDHIEVAYGNDDAFEFFGGTVNAKYLIALAPDDDAFDFDFGYQGNIQFALSILNPSIGYSANPNGIESDNNATGASACKATSATISNLTVIGVEDSTIAAGMSPLLLNGAHIRRASEQLIRNSVFIGFPTGVLWQSAGSIASAPNFQYNTVQAFNTVSNGAVLDGTNRTIRSALANTSQINLSNPWDICGAPDFSPASTSTLVSDPVSFTGLSGFFSVVTYRGACNTGNGSDATWPSAFWTKYDYPPYCVACEN